MPFFQKVSPNENLLNPNSLPGLPDGVNVAVHRAQDAPPGLHRYMSSPHFLPGFHFIQPVLGLLPRKAQPPNQSDF